MALKALRNLFHHHEELLHRVRIIATQEAYSLKTDLPVLCLVDRDLVERAATLAPERDREAVTGAFRWYGAVANVQPAIYNAAVDVFESISAQGVSPSSDAYRAFEASYQFEAEMGHPHHVNGDIWCRAGNVDEVLRVLFQQERTAQQ